MTLPIASPSDIVQRLEAARRARAAERVLVAFDADGTLWSGDVGEDSFAALLASGEVRDAAHAALAEEAARFAPDATGDARALLARLALAHEAGAMPEDRAYALMAWAFAGWSVAEVRARAAALVERLDLRARRQAETAPVIDWARAQGVPLWVVSASPRAMVEAGLASLGMGDARVIAMTPRQAGDVLLPDVERPIPYADGKAAALAAQADGARVLGAFGDSTFDLAMMAVSDVPVAVRPKATLRARAGEVPTLVEIGR